MTDRIDHATLETDVPPGKTTYDCPYCGRPFRREEYRTLHVGLTHYDVMTEAETAAFQDAYREEKTELGPFRLKALAALVVLYFGLLIVYSIVT
ncbi:DUF7410 domain-containing protein [Haloarchaeobius sp. TZWWS8]|uniref:DUF7410 domain-containing protein n=1 Tax=Haloarchaeobius sp. TZWWS8 TaxID=3446121 RepID=UPI003EBDA674